MRRLPARDALVVFIDFGALRKAGLLDALDSSKVGEDPEYRRFVESSRFDFKRDLDSALAAFAPTGRFLLLTGRFDWSGLTAYVHSQGGACNAGFCRMIGSAPERRISFFPLRSNLMALAVSQDDSAALRLSAVAEEATEAPDAPVWLSVPGSVLKTASVLPEGARDFTGALGQAESLTLGLAPEGARLAARLDIRCRNGGDAASVAADLTRITSMLRESIAKENHQPNPAELSGVLAGGSFRNEGARALGYWPIEKVFVDALLGGR